MSRGIISYNLDKNILFDKLNNGENILVLYNSGTDYKWIFQKFAQQIVNDGSTPLYVFHNTNKINFGFNVQNSSFNIINENVIHKLKANFDKYINRMEKHGKNMLLLSDWSKGNLSNCEIFIPFLEDYIKKSQCLSPTWKRNYKQPRHKIPLTSINAFEIKNLNEKFIKDLIKLHQRVCLIQENTNTFLLPTISPSLETIFPKFHVLPQNVLEKLAKDNLAFITLLFLERGNKSGYQILKDIANHFHCILSQGTLYPLLYKLEKENKIIKQNGKGREILYSLTKKSKEDLQSKKEILLNSYQHLASFFNPEGQ